MGGRVLTAILVAVTGVVTPGPVVWADGGVVQLSQRAGPFEVTVFTAPTPLRVGPVDLSVMVRTGDDQRPVLDAEVAIHLASEDGGPPIMAPATRALATNKLLYAAPVELPRAGRWRLMVDVAQGGRRARVATALTVISPASPLISLWFYLALPPIVIALFILHRWLEGRFATTTTTTESVAQGKEMTRA